jgi:hypothetical protein
VCETNSPTDSCFLDLRGHSAGTPVTPDAALARILRGVGVLAEAIPSTVEERSAMLRGRLAGARMLMLLDNAHDADQVRPLLPGSGNLVVVASRNQLRGLVAREGAKRLALRSFGKRDATALSAGSVGYDRLHAEPEAVEELAELCGRLPLALTLAGEHASRFSELSIAGIVDVLLPAAAVLSDTPVREARELLDQLASAHLLNQPRADCHGAAGRAWCRLRHHRPAHQPGQAEGQDRPKYGSGNALG